MNSGLTQRAAEAEEAEKQAEALLSQHWTHRSLPVDPAEIARNYGVEILYRDLPERVSGALVRKPNIGTYIVVKSGDAPQRQSFTIAHELGHFLRDMEKTDIGKIDHRNPLSTMGVDPEEIFANNFAAGLLMPKDRVRAYYTAFGRNSIFPSNLLAPLFGVSREAMDFRLKNLRLAGR